MLAIFLLKVLLKSFQNGAFFGFGVEIRFWSCIFGAAVCSCILFCNAVSANRIVVAASRFLGATAACVIVLSFAAEHRKSQWNGCMKVAIVMQENVLILALFIFLLKVMFKSLKIVFFFGFGVEIRFWSCIVLQYRSCFARQCLIKRHCSVCVKVSWCHDRMSVIECEIKSHQWNAR